MHSRLSSLYLYIQLFSKLQADDCWKRRGKASCDGWPRRHVHTRLVSSTTNEAALPRPGLVALPALGDDAHGERVGPPEGRWVGGVRPIWKLRCLQLMLWHSWHMLIYIYIIIIYTVQLIIHSLYSFSMFQSHSYPKQLHAPRQLLTDGLQPVFRYTSSNEGWQLVKGEIGMLRMPETCQRSWGLVRFV